MKVIYHEDFKESYCSEYNPTESDPNKYLKHVEEMLPDDADIIGISAGFDNHKEDWGGVLSTDNYREMERMVRNASRKSGGGCFAILEEVTTTECWD